jgi:hypothetical protein
VHIAATANDVVAAAEGVLNRSDQEQRRWRARAARLVAAHNWGAIAAEMLKVMSRVQVTSTIALPTARAAALSA